MQYKISLKQSLLIGGAAGAAAFLIFMFFFAADLSGWNFRDISAPLLSDENPAKVSYHGNIISDAKANDYYRRVLFTGLNSQLVIMSIPPGGEVGKETHKFTEQTLFFLSGTGEGEFDGNKFPIIPGDVAVVVPGTEHNFRNTGTQDLKIYTVYAPANHIDGREHVTKADSDADILDESVGEAAPISPGEISQPLKNPMNDTLDESMRMIISGAQVKSGIPVRLKIPVIKVDAPVRSLGLDPDGAVAAPTGGVDTAWFNLGPRPGEIGSAVISGHYGTWKTGGGSVFDNINRLKAGDRISVEDENGAAVNFIVREIRTFDPDAEAGSVFSSNDGKAHLNLITCEGIWDGSAKTYSKRLVVFSDKE